MIARGSLSNVQMVEEKLVELFNHGCVFFENRSRVEIDLKV